MISSKNITSIAAILGVFAICGTLPATASPTKKKSSVKAASRTAPVQSVKTYSCEGKEARISSNMMSGSSRNEYSISFGMIVNRASSSVMIMGARGSNIIRSGKYNILPVADGFSLFMDWNDGYNMPQTASLSFLSDGKFTGQSSESGSNANPASAMMCGLFGSELCQMTNVSISRNIEAVCWQQ